jgi:hypothetical protein
MLRTLNAHLESQVASYRQQQDDLEAQLHEANVRALPSPCLRIHTLFQTLK